MSTLSQQQSPATTQPCLSVFSSRTSEEGFHSGSSQDETSSNNDVDRLAFELNNFGVSQKRLAYGQQKCNSDSGASSAELEQNTMKEESAGRDASSTTAPTAAKPKMPGSWYYEEGMFRGEDSSSPSSEADELYLAQLLCAARNISENVEVPSSEHVAEIVGRQGCKIKALRAKTNTYIKTPVRGEEPVFVVTGKPEDVMEAKREIECAAEHFTQIRASRRHSQGGAPAPGHVTAYVRVPLRVVGLVVGPKGATIKRIQQDTHTYIITPSREREPIFEVTGLPQNVEAARKEIEQHIYQRTGNMPITDPSAPISQYTTEFNSSGSLSTAANATTRSSYGSLATAPPAPGNAPRRPNTFEGFGEFQQRPSPLTESYQFNGLSNIMRGGYPNSKVYSCSSPTPSLFNQWSQNSNNMPFQPWSTNTYSGLGISEQNQDMFYDRSNILNGASAWSSAFSSVSCSLNEHRDEGLGDSPASGNENPYRLMSSIWADIEPRDENKQVVPAVLTA
ncbi:unnamed protein product [Auanema sp. JU1783]|nr:unnamed protein product [Auanema sp. JU1783]